MAGPGRHFARAIVSPYEPGSEVVEIGPGQKEAEVTLSLDRGSVLSGRVKVSPRLSRVQAKAGQTTAMTTPLTPVE